jgi:hypothetical protein
MKSAMLGSGSASIPLWGSDSTWVVAQSRFKVDCDKVSMHILTARVTTMGES